MSQCAYHTHSSATVNCNGCGKALCPSCDHRIKGFPYCQDCIVAGVELLRNNNNAIYVPIVKKQTSPLLASVLSLLCPGLGAAYNGQITKGMIHFVAFIGLFQMAIVSSIASPFFVLGFLGVWLYSALDAWRTAQAIRAGVTPSEAESVLVNRFRGNTKLWGAVLVVIGGSFVLQTIFNFEQILTRFILPVLLIGIGVYLLVGFVKRNEDFSEEEVGRTGSLSPGRDDAYGYDSRQQNYSRKWKN